MPDRKSKTQEPVWESLLLSSDQWVEEIPAFLSWCRRDSTDNAAAVKVREAWLRLAKLH